jgi:alkyl hydroperoxide reductase subunit D
MALDRLLTLPEPVKDIKLNVHSLLTGTLSLDEEQRWGVALAAAFASRSASLVEQVRAAAGEHATSALVADAYAAATLMAMNNVFYRFRHFAKKGYGDKPARLRMNRLAQPATNKATFELMSLGVSAINGCEVCVEAHEHAIIKAGLSEDQVSDCIRIAANITALATAIAGVSLFSAD